MSDQFERDPLTNPSEEVQSEQPVDTSKDFAGDLAAEIRVLGHQLETALRAALESERTKQIQRDLAGGLQELSSQVRNALQNVQEDPRVQQASDRGREMLRNAQNSKTANDLQETLVTGVAQLNVHLRKLIERIEASTTTPATPSQDVPVEAPPVVGETTRLDDDTKF